MGYFFSRPSLQSYCGRPQLPPGSCPLLTVSLSQGPRNSFFLLPLQAQDSEGSSLLLGIWYHTVLSWFLHMLPTPL